MKKANYFCKLMLLAGLCLTAFSCSEDDAGGIEPPLRGETQKTKGSVVSEDGPQKNQSHRSSNNFYVNELVNYNKPNAFIRWTLDAGKENIQFKVKIDKSGTDPDFYQGQYITHGTITPIDDNVRKYKKLYIADPKNAKGDFTVHYEIGVPEARHIYLACKDVGGSKSKRASENIVFQASRYKIDCPSDARFYLRHDKGGQADDYYIGDEALQNGDIICAYPDAFISGSNKSFTLHLEPVDELDLCAWMGKLPDNTKLAHLSIPGTHDSATGTKEIDAGYYKCQNFDFPVQMSDGIRFFDVRLNKNLMTHHGDEECGTSCEQLFEYARVFLEKYYTETLLFLVTAEDAAKFVKFAESSEVCKKLLYRADKMPTLGEARGKVILLRRFEVPAGKKISEWGIDMQTSWPDNEGSFFWTAADEQFYVEDFYGKVMEEHDTQKKTDMLKQGVAWANEARNKDCFFIQYSSVACKPVFGARTPWDYAWGGTGVNPVMNTSLDEIFKSYEAKTPARVGTIVMDFYNKHGYDDPYKLAQRIINFNFPEDKE